ncbi:hypothetical protein FCH28_37075 [Streptomyces piniterrae]|uniref:Uncharacterized protein n=1 Tax=Streptomyces piniterrae TaxID=2571125 RepID=A0A4U0ML97_9ACTN|nr:hypothetical protein [Streptomyces piniterrae]TJZ41450.1 hypothetical protein FCH28_37075 [Streptomyces piniterrae]
MADYWNVIIGSASALLGTTATGYFGLRQGWQNSYEKERDRESQRWLVHREARRAACSKLVSKHYEFDKFVEELWSSRPGENRQIIADTEVTVASLLELVTLVQLEGPPSVGNAAESLGRADQEVATELQELSYQATRRDDDRSLSEITLPEVREVEDIDSLRKGKLEEFIHAARQAIGGESG